MIPPAYLLLSMLSMIILHLLFPGFVFACFSLFIFGLALIALGFSLVAWSAKLFSNAGTPIRPFEETSTLVIWGPYRHSRNPIYIGMFIMLLGVALALGSVTPFLLIPAFIMIIRQKFVLNEERLLIKRFGNDYQQYCAKVRRWL